MTVPTSPTMELIRRHCSVRSYRADPVSPELVESIVAAAQRSSTSSNLQMWTVVALRDLERRARMAELCGQQEQVKQAPVFLQGTVKMRWRQEAA